MKLTKTLVIILLLLVIQSSQTQSSQTQSSQTEGKSSTLFIENEWFNGLAKGVDMSNTSRSYADHIKARKNTAKGNNHPLPRANDYSQDFDKRYKDYSQDIDKLSKQASKSEHWQNKVIYLQQSYQLAKDSQQQLLKHLNTKKQFLQNKSASANKIARLQKLIESAQNKLDKQTHNKLGNKLNKFTNNSDWQSFLTREKTNTQKALKQTIQTQNSPKPIILRSSNLPYASLESAAPSLVYTPEITPSYATRSPREVDADDLSADKIVQINDEIKQLVRSLGHRPIDMYNYVRLHVRLQYYSGAQKGAQGTLVSNAGNDIDQAALLIALLRQSNIPARFVHGVIRQPIEQVMKSIGLSEPAQVLAALNSAGIAHVPIIEGGQLRAVHREYTWVSAYIPYGSYRGSIADSSEKIWIPMAPAIKTNSIKTSDYHYQDAGINPDQLILDYFSDNNNQSPLLYWQNQVQADINTNHTDIDYNQLFNRHIASIEIQSLLASSLPFDVIATTAESARVDSQQIRSIQLQLGENGQYLDVTLSLPELAGKRLSLSYLPASVDDLNIVNQAGGMASVAPYLVDLRAQIKIDGRSIEANNTPVPMASVAELKITINGRAGATSYKRNTLIGNYLSIVLSSQNDQYPLDSEDANLFANETRPIRIMNNLGRHYNHKWNQAETNIAAIMDLAIIKPIPAVTIIAPEFSLIQSQGLITQMQFKGISIDAISRPTDVISRQVPAFNSYDFYRISALQGSYLESDIFMSQWALDAVSADKGLNQAQGPLLHLSPDNYLSQLASTNHPQHVKDQIASWLALGNHAVLTNDPDHLDTWGGSSWHIYNPLTGYSGYFISGVYAGGQTTQNPSDWVNSPLFTQLSAPYGEGSNQNPLSAVSIELIGSTNNQFNVVATELDTPLAVIIRDVYNNPVANASVTFEVNIGKATLLNLENSSQSTSSLTVKSNALGLARMNVKTAKKIETFKLGLLNVTDEKLSKVGVVYISTSVQTSLGKLKADEDFQVISVPDTASSIQYTCGINDSQDCLQQSNSVPLGAESPNIHFRVVDQYDNFVSNIDVTLESVITQSNKNQTSTAEVFANNKNANKTNFNKITHKFTKVKITGDENTIEPFAPSASRGHNDGLIGPFSPDNDTAMIALHEGCNNHELIAPACAQSTVNQLSDHTWSEFSVYSPVHGNIPSLSKGFTGYTGNLLTGNYPHSIIFTGAGVASATLDMNTTLWDYTVGNVPGSTTVTTVIAASIIRGENNGPFGNWEAGSAGQMITVPRRFYFDQSEYDYREDGNVYYFSKVLHQDIVSTSNVDANLNLDGFDFLTYTMAETPGQVISTLTLNPVNTSETLDLSDSIFTASVEVSKITPETFELNSESKLISPVSIEIETHPSDYRAKDITVKFYKNGSIIDELTNKFPAGNKSTTLFDPSQSIDLDALYEVEVTLNQNTPFEIKSVKTPIQGFSQKILTQVRGDGDNGASSQSNGGLVINKQITNAIKVQTTIDLSDPQVCKDEGMNIFLNSDADVIIELDRLDASGLPTSDNTTIANGRFPAGSNNIAVNAEELGNDSFNIKITSISVQTGDTEIVRGTLNSVFAIKDSLLISHPVIKGVDLADGSMIYSKQDIKLPAPGADLEFIHTYSNNSRYQLGPMGYGWSHNYMSRVIVNNCGRLTVTGADGGTNRFKIINEQIQPLKGFHSTLVANGDGSFSYYTKNGTHYHYVKRQARTWWANYIEDTNGNRLMIELHNRSGAPIIKSVTDSVGRKLIYNYNIFTIASNPVRPINGELLTSITGPNGIALNFSYDQTGHLISAKREGDTTNESYQYSTQLSGFNLNLLTSITDNATGAIRTYHYADKTITLPAGMSISNDIQDKQISLISETDAGTTSFSYTNTQGFNDTATVNQNGSNTTYNLNDYGAAHSITNPNGIKTMVWEIGDEILLTSETDENNRTKSFLYDTNANLIKETINGISRSYTYLAAGSTPPFIKDRISSYSNWRGNITTFEYDNKGNKMRETLAGISTSFNYNPQGLLIGITDARGNNQSLSYDNYGQLASQIDGAGNQANTVWDIRGRKTIQRDANGNISNFTYDSSDRITMKTLSTGQLRSWRFSYLNGGLNKTETDPNGSETRFNYDKMGRLLNINNAGGNNFSYTYDANGNKLSENDFNVTALFTHTIQLTAYKPKPKHWIKPPIIHMIM